MKYMTHIFFIFYAILSINANKNTFSLGGSEWTVTNKNKSISIPAIVPGGIYSDLMRESIIGDIYFEDNDVKTRWIAQDEWTYNLKFDVDKEILNYSQINLVFEGLDTVSTIFFNGKQIKKTDNMFVKYIIDISGNIKLHDNTLLIQFASPIKEAKRLYNIQAKKYNMYPICVPSPYHGECHVNFLRKMQASFAWDWGPAFPSVGIWKPVYIEYFDDAIIRDVTIQTIMLGSNWIVNTTIYLDSKLKKVPGMLEAKLTTNIEKVSTFYYLSNKKNLNDGVAANFYLTIPQSSVDLWWPNGYGEQRLYKFLITYTSDDGQTYNKTMNIGFRTIELVQKPLTSGLTFYFKVNSVIIFAKGSNWIPANILPEKGYKKSFIKYLLLSAKNVNMNMLRVWGGGLYESDYFYEMADKLGILIWQDLMFACALYPVDNAFLNSVNLEVKQQVRRLQYHPSIAVWGGNNENELAIVTGWWPINQNKTQYEKDYRLLYVKNIKETCLRNDPTRPYLVSSPSNGVESERENYFAKNPGDVYYGDVHVYKYLIDGWDHTMYPKPRFASEYGFQSLPSFETMNSATSNINKEFLDHRQHHIGGYEEMKILINKHLDLEEVNDISGFKKFIYYSQVSQAMAIKAETENYRQWSSSVDSIGRGATRGALYWQLNDVWQAPSWSSIDFHGRWKMLHYFAKKFFDTVLVSSRISASRYLSIYISSDDIRTIPDAKLFYTVYRWDDFVPLYEEYRLVTILPGYSSEVVGFYLDEYLSNADCGSILDAKNNCFLILELRSSTNELITYHNFVLPGKLKDAEGVSPPTFRVNVKKCDKLNKFDVFIHSTAIAPFVWLETKYNGKFSDNGFLQFTKVKVIEYYNKDDITEDALEESIKITSIFSEEY